MRPDTAQAILERFQSMPDASLICANSAIQRELLRCLSQHNQQSAVATGRILDLDQYLAQQAARQAEKLGVAVAEREQLLAIWQQLLEEVGQKQSHRPLDAASLAPEALQAWQYLLEWRIPLNELQTAEQYNEQQVADWCKKFEAKLKACGLQSRLQLICQSLQSNATHGQALLVTTGGRLSPLKLSWLESHFARIDTLNLTQTAAKCRRIALDDPKAECHAAALWAAQQWQTNPHARIALVRTDGYLTAPVWRRELNRRLPDNIPLHFNFPRPLETGQIQAAVDLLQLNRPKLSRTAVRRLVNDTSWQLDKSEQDCRSKWEAACCEHRRHWLSFRQTITALRGVMAQMQTIPEAQEALISRVDRFEALRRSLPSTNTLSQWCEHFTAQLDALGWPGQTDSQDDSTETWLNLCNQLQQLNHLYPPCDLERALTLLQRQANNLRQAPDPTAAGVNLLDTLESAVGFDSVWLMGANHQNWPAAPQPNSLLPIPLQQAYQTPRSSPEMERGLCIQLFDHLCGNARQVVFSISCIEPDQSPGFSPILPKCEELQIDLAAGQHRPPPCRLDWVDCSRAPAWSHPGELAPGGSNLLDLMLGSPLVAFARWRLAASELPSASDGLDAMQRGSLVHYVLEALWAELRDQQSLLLQTDEQLRQLQESAIDRALGRITRAGAQLDRQLESGTRGWLNRLLDSWLELERQRPSFRIKSLEQVACIQLGGLRLRLKLDRLDQTADGKLLLMDYKTGNSSASRLALTESPPAAVQLPLYALASEEPVDAVAIAAVVPEKPSIKGIGAVSLTSGIQSLDGWIELQLQWRQDLQQLAADFVAGDTRHFCRPSEFGRRDALAVFHRQYELEELQEWLSNE